MSEQIQAHVIISGKVQGVYYRLTTQEAVEKMGGITGYVKNLRDGNVEAVFEGEKEQVQKAIDWTWRGSPMSKVTDVNVTWNPYSGKWSTFDVAY